MSWHSRLKNALHPQRLDDDLADEMADHLERRATALNQKGLETEEARRQARLRFGNTTRIREESRGIRLWAGSNWEGTGVEPDVKVPAADALTIAEKLATEKVQAEGHKQQ